MKVQLDFVTEHVLVLIDLSRVGRVLLLLYHCYSHPCWVTKLKLPDF